MLYNFAVCKCRNLDRKVIVHSSGPEIKVNKKARLINSTKRKLIAIKVSTCWSLLCTYSIATAKVYIKV